MTSGTLLPALLIGLAYLLGATPTSYWVGRGAFGVDLRREGSGNLGATNTFRVLGLKAALPVVVVDVAKGWLPVWLFPRLDGSATWEWALAYGAGAILGHVFSVWVGFKGGKGVATGGGVFLVLSPWAVLAGLSAFIAVAFSTRIASLGSLAAAAALPVAVLFLPHEGGDALVWFTTGLAGFVFWSHRSNIGRLLRGEENRFGQARDEAEPEGAPTALDRKVTP